MGSEATPRWSWSASKRKDAVPDAIVSVTKDEGSKVMISTRRGSWSSSEIRNGTPAEWATTMNARRARITVHTCSSTATLMELGSRSAVPSARLKSYSLCSEAKRRVSRA